MIRSHGTAAPRLSAYAPFAGPHVTDAAWWIALASSLKLDRVWFGQQSCVPILGGAGYASGRGHRAPLGTAVSLIPATTPFASAMDIRALAQISESTVAAYFSPGYPHIQHALAGRRWDSPLTATREFFTALRGLLAGGRVDVRGEYVSTTFDSPADDVTDRVELGLGILRPGLARLAGEIADGAVTWLASPDYLDRTLMPALRDGAQSAGRSTPRLVATLHAAPGVDAADVASVVRSGIGPHLSAPHYRDMLRRDGIVVDGTLSDDAIATVVDRRLFVVGDTDDVITRANDLLEAGADEVSVVLHQRPGADRSELLSLIHI